MKNKIIGALSMFVLLNIPAIFGSVIGIVYWKAYLIAFITTITVMVAYSIIEYLKHTFKK